MFQSGKWVVRIALVAGLLALTADSLWAGPIRDRLAARRGGSGYYYEGGRGYRGGYYGGDNGGYYGGPVVGRGYRGGYYGGDNGGYYGGPSYGYRGPGYFPGSGVVVVGETTGYQSNYYAPSNDMTVSIDVRVPANAQVFFDDEPTRQSGELRTFTTPTLSGDRSYHYTVRAKWEENGKPVERKQTIEFRTGRRVVVDFLRPETTPEEKDKTTKPKLGD
jgi:uncharacterized protein (TIGR03000 family)